MTAVLWEYLREAVGGKPLVTKTADSNAGLCNSTAPCAEAVRC
jgi:hypothetical protein